MQLIVERHLVVNPFMLKRSIISRRGGCFGGADVCCEFVRAGRR